MCVCMSMYINLVIKRNGITNQWGSLDFLKTGAKKIESFYGNKFGSLPHIIYKNTFQMDQRSTPER